MIDTIGDTVTGLPAVPAATGETTTNGGTLTGRPTTVTTVLTGTLLSDWSSVTANVTVLTPTSADVSVTDCSNC